MAPLSASSSVTESVVSFLEKIPPFQFLPVAELRSLAKRTSLEYFAKDSVILAAGHRASDSFYIVQKGAVKLAIRTQVGKELVLDMRGEGEVFGLLSIVSRDVARLDVVAVEDTFCYSIAGEDMQEHHWPLSRGVGLPSAHFAYPLHGSEPERAACPGELAGEC